MLISLLEEVVGLVAVLPLCDEFMHTGLDAWHKDAGYLLHDHLGLLLALLALRKGTTATEGQPWLKRTTGLTRARAGSIGSTSA